MTIKTKISFTEYLKLLLTLTYRKPMMIVILCVALAMLAWILGYYLHFLPVPKPLIYQYITLALITVIQPLVIFNTIWINYYSSNHLRECLEIEFTSTEIKIHGDSFYLEMTWEKVYQVLELDHWLLFYQNNLNAIIVPKRSFPGEQAEEFKKFLNTIRGVPVHLKNGLSND